MEEKMRQFDFQALGQAIKKARNDKGWSREELCGMLGISSRYLVDIENEGQPPSLQVLYSLVTLFDISVDQFFFPDKNVAKSTRRRQLDASLDELNEKDYLVLQGTADALKNAKSE